MRTAEGVREWGEVPSRRGGLPWVGHALAFGRDPVGFLQEGLVRAGTLHRFTLLGCPAVFACGPQAHREVLMADDSVIDIGASYPFMKPVFGPGIAYDAPPPEFRAQRAHLTRQLSPVKVDEHVTQMVREAERVLDNWGDGGEVALVPALTEIVAAVTTRCLFGEEIRRRAGAEFVSLYRDMASGLALAGLVAPWVPLPAFRRRDRARQRLAALMQEAVDERRAAPVPDGWDCLSSLLAARTPGGLPLPDETIVGILITMGFAGLHTSSALTAWTGVVLLEQSDLLPAVLAEQHSVVPSDTSPDGAALQRMELLGHCMREAERMYPPTIVLLRKTIKELVLLGHRVPAGTLVVLSPALSHRLSEAFTDPDRCDPLRFAPGREEHRRDHALIGFGGGLHQCIGMAFAQREVKAIWSALLRRFDLEILGGPHRPDHTSTFVAPPNEPCTLRYRRRHDTAL